MFKNLHISNIIWLKFEFIKYRVCFCREASQLEQQNKKIYKLSKTNLTMTNIDVIKMSSKGQIVIPQSMRKNLTSGDKLLIIQNKNQLILKKASEMDKALKEDLEFAKRTEEAYKRIESGKFISVDSENLEEEMMKW